MSEGEETRDLETSTEYDDPEHPDRTIKCVDCNENFIWTSGEQAFFHDKGLKNEPKRCKPCKQAKNERLAAITAAQTSGVRQRIEVSVNCAQCGQQTTVPFILPRAGRFTVVPVSWQVALLKRIVPQTLDQKLRAAAGEHHPPVELTHLCLVVRQSIHLSAFVAPHVFSRLRGQWGVCWDLSRLGAAPHA